MSENIVNLLDLTTHYGDRIELETYWSGPDKVLLSVFDGEDGATAVLTDGELAKLAHDLTTIVHQRRMERTEKYLGQLMGGL